MILHSLKIGATALFAQQKAIDVVSQNIANVNTPGYSKQNAELVSRLPSHISGKDFGNGVKIAAIRRSVDHILTDAQTRNGEQTSYSKTLHQELQGIEVVFSNLDTPGLTTVLNDFFAAQQQLTNRPEDPATRHNVLARARDVATHITDMRRQLADHRNSINQQISPLLEQVNTLLDQIADLNRQITLRPTANDLLDKRDKAIQDLAQLVPIRRITTNDTGLLLQTPGGDLLVRDDMTRHLKIGAGSPFGKVEFVDTSLPAAGVEQGGKLGALLELRDGRIANYIGQLDSLAANLIFSLNQQHTGGTGLTAVSSYTAGQASTDPAGTSIAVNADPSVPFASQIKTGTFTIHVLDSTGNPLTPPGPGGTGISITAGVTKLSDIATAINAINGVSASINKGRLNINGGNNRIVFANDTSNFLAAYEINAFFHGSSAANISVDDAINNDSGRIATGMADAATSAVSPADNRVALAILTLRDKAISIDGTNAASPAQRASTLAGDYGMETAAAMRQLSYHEAEADILNRRREAVSGVNVDEEMIRMIELQRAYEASAKVIQSSNRMLDSLMGLIR